MRERESRDVAPPARGLRPRARPGRTAGVLALQRAAGNRAVRRLLQRDLEIFDQNLTFTDPVVAQQHLAAEYAKHYKQPLDLAQQQRLTEVAQTASFSNEVVQVSLARALAYIHDKTPAQEVRKLRNPSLSPARGPAPDWTYEMADWAPTALEAPQSPQHLFPAQDYAPLNIDIAMRIDEQQSLLSGERTARTKEKLGKNLFQYRVGAHLRITPMSEIVGAETTYAAAKPPEYRESSAQSRMYQSRFMLPGEKPGEDEMDYETEIRGELDRLYEGGKKLTEFHAKSTLYAHERDSTAKDRSGGYFTDTSRSKPGAISTMFVHSEVQAAAHAHEEAGKKLADAVQEQIVKQARAVRIGAEPIEVVVVAVEWEGFSDPNTVCSNACKGALVHISQILETRFTEARHAAKPQLRKEGIFLRASGQFTLSGHVQGQKHFQGMGVGATKAAKSTKTRNRTVIEYKPKQ